MWGSTHRNTPTKLRVFWNVSQKTSIGEAIGEEKGLLILMLPFLWRVQHRGYKHWLQMITHRPTRLCARQSVNLYDSGMNQRPFSALISTSAIWGNRGKILFSGIINHKVFPRPVWKSVSCQMWPVRLSDRRLFRLCVSSWVNFGSLCLLRNQSISSRLSKLLA